MAKAIWSELTTGRGSTGAPHKDGEGARARSMAFAPMARPLAAIAAAIISCATSSALADGAAPAASSSAKADPAPKSQGAAAPAKSDVPAWETAPAERRAGFTLGVLFAGAAGDVSGYPNDVNKKGQKAFFADTGAAFGGGGTLFLGGALADWLVFGAGLSAAGLSGNGLLVTGFTFTLHTEVFPLYPLGGLWREVGVAMDTGAGSYTADVQNKPAGAKAAGPVIDSGAASRFAVALFYDGFRASKLSAGPFVGFDYAWSGTMERPLFVLGLRGALYAKGPKKK